MIKIPKIKLLLWNVVLILISMLIQDKAYSQTVPTLSVNPAQGNVPLGSQAQVGLLVTNGVGINSFDVIIEYDQNFLEFDGWTNGGFLSDLSVVKKVEEEGYFWLICTQLKPEPVSGSGTLVNLYFSTRALGTTTIVIDWAEFSDVNGNPITTSTVDGSVTVNYTSTYTPTATATQTPFYTATNTSQSTQSLTGTIQPTSQTQSPSRTSTITPIPPTATPTRFPTATTGYLTPNATETPEPYPGVTETLRSTETTELTSTHDLSPTPTQPLSAETQSIQTQISRLSATPIKNIGAVEGSSPGIGKIPSEVAQEEISPWLWVMLGTLIVIGLVLLIVWWKVRNKFTHKLPYE